jgi:hypothetical protein
MSATASSQALSLLGKRMWLDPMMRARARARSAVRNCKPGCAEHSLIVPLALPQPSCPLRCPYALSAGVSFRAGGIAPVVGATPALAEAFAAAGTASAGLSAARLLPLLTEPVSFFQVLLPPQRLILALPLYCRSFGLALSKAGFVFSETSSYEALDPIIYHQ